MQKTQADIEDDRAARLARATPGTTIVIPDNWTVPDGALERDVAAKEVVPGASVLVRSDMSDSDPWLLYGPWTKAIGVFFTDRTVASWGFDAPALAPVTPSNHWYGHAIDVALPQWKAPGVADRVRAVEAAAAALGQGHEGIPALAAWIVGGKPVE